MKRSHPLSGSSFLPRFQFDILAPRVSPVVKVHDGLDGVPASRGDVSLEAGQQWGHDVHAVLLALPVRKTALRKKEKGLPASSCA